MANPATPGGLYTDGPQGTTVAQLASAIDDSEPALPEVVAGTAGSATGANAGKVVVVSQATGGSTLQLAYRGQSDQQLMLTSAGRAAPVIGWGSADQ